VSKLLLSVKTLAHYKQTTTTKSYKGDIDLYKGEILIGEGDGGKTTPCKFEMFANNVFFTNCLQVEPTHQNQSPH
jgi:ATP-dependent protease Clp ATPase subunit